MNRIAVSVTALLFLPALSLAGPAISLSETTFNFGKSVQKAFLTHDFWIRSTGDEPLRIIEVEPGCGCTESWLSDSTIQPGDSANLHIVFSTGRYRGHIDKQPYLVTNVSDEKVYLQIAAELEIEPEKSKPVALRPTIVDVSQFDERPRLRARFVIENRTDEKLKIEVVDSSFKSFTVEIPHEIGAAGEVTALVTVRPDAAMTAFEESITIQLSDDGRSRYSIPVKRMIPRDLAKSAKSGR